MSTVSTSTDFLENAVFLKLNKNYKKYIAIAGNCNPKDFLLYEASRGYWRMNKDRADKVKYAVPVYDDKILTVYEVHGWYEAETTPRTKDFVGSDSSEGDLEFIGWIAKDEILLKHINRSVVTYRNPVHYADNEN